MYCLVYKAVYGNQNENLKEVRMKHYNDQFKQIVNDFNKDMLPLLGRFRDGGHIFLFIGVHSKTEKNGY